MAGAMLSKYALPAHEFRGRRSLVRCQTTANDSVVMSYNAHKTKTSLLLVRESLSLLVVSFYCLEIVVLLVKERFKVEFQK